MLPTTATTLMFSNDTLVTNYTEPMVCLVFRQQAVAHKQTERISILKIHQLKLWPFGLSQSLYNLNLYFRVKIALYIQLKNGALMVGNKNHNFHTIVQQHLGGSPWPIILASHPYY